ncbi:MAG: YihY/virulence factor BrkB family protein [Anaerolineae bacterium]|nr:YihY/virulence factor BrkB family protein [Anaerolineae bacterium]
MREESHWVRLRKRARQIYTSADRNLGGRLSLLRTTWREFQDDNGFTMAAAIAYYALFSFFPVVLLMIPVSSFFFSSERAQQEVIVWVERYMPASGNLVKANLGQVLRVRRTASLVALLGLLWSASGVFTALDRVINKAWDVTELRPFWQQKLLAFGMILGAGGLLLLSILSTTFFNVIRRLRLPLTGWQLLGNLLSTLLPVTLTISIFLLLYKILPNTTVRWSDVWLGALLAGLGWESAKYLFTWYLANFASYNLVYGSVALIIAFLVWSYYTGVILILGAEFTAEFAKTRRACKRPG